MTIWLRAFPSVAHRTFFTSSSVILRFTLSFLHAFSALPQPFRRSLCLSVVLVRLDCDSNFLRSDAERLELIRYLTVRVYSGNSLPDPMVVAIV
jgi:hypothetical protein